MTDRAKIKDDIQKIANDSKEIEKDVVAYVHKASTELHDKSREEVLDIYAATGNLLIGVEDGLKAAGHESAEIIAKAANVIVDVTSDISKQSLEAAQSYAQSAKSAVETAVEAHKGEFEHIEEATKEGMKDAHSKLAAQTRHVLEQMETVSKAVYDYSVEKAHELDEAVAPKVQAAADKSRVYAKETEQHAAEFSKNLLHHSQEKTATWLRKLASLVEPGDAKKE